ncbi:amino acid or sugar ABC transport system, permease protein [delta proteobacterium NaphS2]|nr:amino acid or sugar ABC transport system, permease protein [delta proteobacterium NaphS2]
MDILIYGLINAASLILLAVGFSLIYGVSRVANFAHGAVYIATGFIAWALMNKAGLNYPLSIVLSVVVSALLGVGIYQGLLIRVRGMPASEIIASFAIAMGMIEALKVVGFVGSYGNPVFVRGSVEVLGIPVDYQRLISVLVAFGTVVFLYVFIRRTKIGLSLRGIAQDERSSMMLGINSDLAATISLAIGSALAGIAAVVLLPLGNMYPGIGYEALIYAVAVCIVGGLGSLGGTVFAGLMIAFAQVITVRFLGGQWRMLVIFLAILVILVFKPSGLLGRQKELEERV